VGSIPYSKGERMNQINKWLDILWELDKEQKNEDIQSLRTFLFDARGRIKKEQNLIKEKENK
jgi:hypothetical protein